MPRIVSNGTFIINGCKITAFFSDMQIFSCIYDGVFDFHEGLAWVEKDEKYGVIDKTGKYLDSCVVKPFLKGSEEKNIKISKEVVAQLIKKYNVEIRKF